MNDASANPPRPRGVSMTTLILGVALATAVTAAVVLAVLHFAGAGSGGVTSSGTDQAFVQRETVKPQGHTAGDVVYPIPYAVPPHLTLNAPHRSYSVVKQSETGFSWAADDLPDDFDGDRTAIMAAIQAHNVANALFGGQFKRSLGVVYEDFTWEAKGVAAGAAADMDLPLEQTGTFQSVLGKEGQEYFAIPYASPPQITLSGCNGTTIVSEATSSGFKWKNAGTENPFPGHNEGAVIWTTKGLRAPKAPK